MPEVGIAQLRRELTDRLERARAGDEIVITDRGRPVARLRGIDTTRILERLEDEGTISPPLGPGRRQARADERVAAQGEIAELLVADRDARR